MKLGKSQREKEPVRVASVAVFSPDGLLLFGKRTDSGKWTLPGGHLEPGEDHRDAAARELKEEAGLDGQDFQYIGQGMGGPKDDIVIYSYRCVASGEPDASDDPDEECDEWRWVEPDDVPTEILDNLHAPKNVTLRLLGIQETEDELSKADVSGKKAIPVQHYSNVEGLSELHPKFQGTGHVGAERNRSQRIPRTYFYTRPGTPEAVVAGGSRHLYHGELPAGTKLYNMGADPLKLMQDKYVQTKYGMEYRPADLDAVERKIKKLGYHGYHNYGVKDAIAYFYPLKVRAANRPLKKGGQDYSVWWHGTPTGDLRGGVSGLHVGTRAAAEQALHARIGVPAVGAWDGTREYGKTLLAGRNTLMARGVSPSGFNRLLPDEDHFPDFEKVKEFAPYLLPTHKPEIFPLKIIGPMSNHIGAPHQDFKANGYMAGQLKRGTAKRGYYYINVGEDSGSISATLPGPQHIERLPLGSPQDLQKGLPGLALVGALSVGAALDSRPAPSIHELAQKQGFQAWTPDSLHPDLHPIAHLESGFGRDVAHHPHSKGVFYTAFGALGFKPVTAHEEYRKSKYMQGKYPGLQAPERFLETFQQDPKFYNLLASAHFERLKRRHGGPQQAAFAWRWGTGAAAKASPEQIKSDAYVQKYTHMNLHQKQEPIQKAESEAHRLAEQIKPHLTDDLRRAPWKGSQNCLAGHCYVASEALYHLLGGASSGYVPQSIRHEGGPHWYLKHRENGQILDPTASQFGTPVPYERGVGKGFLTKQPSKRAQVVIDSVLGRRIKKAEHHLNTPEFKTWFGDSKVVHPETRQPLRVYHGTTHDFKEFSHKKGNPENAMGRGHYFTDTPEDVGHNYATASGPDLRARIEQAVDRAAPGQEARALRTAEKKLIGPAPRTIPAYLKMSNPAVLDPAGGTTYHLEEETDENGDYTGKTSGTGQTLIDAIEKTAKQYNKHAHQPLSAGDILSHFAERGLNLSKGVSAHSIDEALREYDPLLDLTNHKGENLHNEFIRDVFRNAGHDGVIVNASRFRMPGIQKDTKHYIVFDPTQIKSAVGNTGAYDPKEKDFGKDELEPVAKNEDLEKVFEDPSWRPGHAEDYVSTLRGYKAEDHAETEQLGPSAWLHHYTNKSNPHYHSFLLSTDSEKPLHEHYRPMAGFFSLQDKGASGWHVDTTVVHPRHQKQGLGKLVYRHLAQKLGGIRSGSSQSPEAQKFWHGLSRDPGLDVGFDNSQYGRHSLQVKKSEHDPLEAILAHENPRERVLALKSKAVTPYHLRLALQDEDFSVREAVARHPMMTASLIEEALRHPDIQTRRAVLARPDLQEQHLEQAIWDPELQVQAARHPALTEEQRQKLAAAQDTPEGLRSELLSKSIGYVLYPKLNQARPATEPMTRTPEAHKKFRAVATGSQAPISFIHYNTFRNREIPPEKRYLRASVSMKPNSSVGNIKHETQHSVFAALKQKYGREAGHRIVATTLQALDAKDHQHLRNITDWAVQNRYNPLQEPEERIAYLQNYLQDSTWRKSSHKHMRIHMDADAERLSHDWAKQIWQKLRTRAESLGPEHVGVVRKDEDSIQSWLLRMSEDESEHRAHEDMLGLSSRTEAHLEAAKFLSHTDPDRAAFRQALLADVDILDAALMSVGLEPGPDTRKALRAVLSLQAADLKKANKAHDVQALMPDGTKTAEAVGRGFEADKAEHLHLGGKHSAGTLMIEDPETNRVFLLKPGSGAQSPARGAGEESAGQSRREACFWHVAEAWGLNQRVPRADLLLIDGQEVAALHMLPLDWKNLEKLRFKDVGLPHKALEKYRQNGELHKWAILDWVAGNVDRHGQNLMVGPEKDGYPVALIDHGSAFAGTDFDPAHDRNSFIPYYLRAWRSESWPTLDPEQRLRAMPVVSGDTEKQLREWFQGIHAQELESILHRYGINPEPTLNRLAQVKALLAQPNFSEAVNSLWLGLTQE